MAAQYVDQREPQRPYKKPTMAAAAYPIASIDLTLVTPQLPADWLRILAF